MKNLIYKLSFVALTASLLISCEDELEIVNPNRLATEAYFTTQDQAIASVDAVYNALIVDGLYQRLTPVLGDGRGDEVRSRSPLPWYPQTSNFTVPATDAFGDIPYVGYYILVNRANQALENIPNIEDVDEGLRDRLLGQAYFLRALAYFNLTNVYDNVPLVLTVPQGLEDFAPSNQDITQEIIYDQVEADLIEAIARLPLSYIGVSGSDSGQVGRVTLGAANALMGRLKLYEGNPEAALPFLREVVNSQQYDLDPNYGSLFSQDPTVEAASRGRIFWAEFTQSLNAVFNWGGDPNVNWRQFIALAPTYSGADFYDFFPTQFIVDELRSERTVDDQLDPRYAATILSYDEDEGLVQAYGGDFFLDRNTNFIAKYTLANSGGDPFSAGINYHIIRFADVLLMYAECLANSGNMSLAAEQVQRVRDRANLPDREVEFSSYSLNQFMDQLAHERVTELGIEGLRYYDIKRWGWLEDPAKLAELSANDEDFNTFTAGREYQPIPQNELDRNPNLIGNSANQ
ncbi:MAG: RagB/SusD family nutrient uptake outer membrane protein [Leeuwenhoekiella sp.]